ncbi:MAG: hypothetical protein RBT73_09420 [Spirochaetia bacterium]|nr:hypothetical protein [Spirochaetia bacterium]
MYIPIFLSTILFNFSNKSTITVLVRGKMTRELVDLPSYAYLLDYFRDYANPKEKISRECRKGTLIRLKQGIYVTRSALDEGIPRGLIANRIYGPSYVSFAFALRLYGLIPEDVPNPTSATLAKHRQKRFNTGFGTYYYRDIPEAVYSEDIVYVRAGRWRYLAATAEKALCDELSCLPAIRSKKAMRALLFENLRIDEHGFEKLEARRIAALVTLYKSTTLDTLGSFLEG